MNDISSILSSLGYTLRDKGAYWRTMPLYRESDNPEVLSIDKKTGRWIDFAADKKGDLKKLIHLTATYQGIEIDAQKLLESVDYRKIIQVKPRIKTIKYYDNEILNKLVKDHSYWVNRRISLDIISKFNGGVARTGKLQDRYVFPIYDEEKRIVGFTGRDLKDLTNEERKQYGRAKWKHLFQSSDVVYPLFSISGNERAILVESVGDFLSLYQAGYQNVFVAFGVKLSQKLINFLVKTDYKKIVIATNNDSDHNGVGNKAADVFYKRLLSFFDKDQVGVCLPPDGFNDWNEMDTEQIRGILK